MARLRAFKSKKFWAIFLPIFLTVVLFCVLGFIGNAHRYDDSDRYSKYKPPGYPTSTSTNINIANFENYAAQISGDGIDYKTAYDKGISSSKDSMTQELLDIQAKYDVILSQFFEEKLPITDLNKQFGDLSQIVPIPKVEASKIYSTQCYYHNISPLDSSYIFLRNNIHVERLGETDIQLLKNSDPTDPSTHAALMDMISRTYADVLSVKISADNGRKGELAPEYEDNSPGITEAIPYDAIVFWASYDNKWAKNGDYADSTQATQDNRTSLLLAQEYSQKFSNSLGHNVKIFVVPKGCLTK